MPSLICPSRIFRRTARSATYPCSLMTEGGGVRQHDFKSTGLRTETPSCPQSLVRFSRHLPWLNRWREMPHKAGRSAAVLVLNSGPRLQRCCVPRSMQPQACSWPREMATVAPRHWGTSQPGSLGVPLNQDLSRISSSTQAERRQQAAGNPHAGPARLIWRVREESPTPALTAEQDIIIT